MDANTLAKSIVDQAIGDKPIKKKDAKATERGFARAKVLTPEKRSEIASKGAAKRWSTKKS